MLIASDGYDYNGKNIDISDKLAEIATKLPTIERVIVEPYLGRDGETADALSASFNGQPRRAQRWADAVTVRLGCRPRFLRLPFDLRFRG